MSNQAVDSIRAIFKAECHQGYGHIVESVLRSQKFLTWPASTHKHHCWNGGLVEHTAQVIELAFAMVKVREVQDKNIDKDVVFIAALMHDFGKIDDYEPCIADDAWPCGFKKTQNYYKIHHVVASYNYFNSSVGMANQGFIDGVGHAILAHHGRLEYGSPVTPQTREAWLVHLADMASVQVIERRIA